MTLSGILSSLRVTGKTLTQMTFLFLGWSDFPFSFEWVHSTCMDMSPRVCIPSLLDSDCLTVVVLALARFHFLPRAPDLYEEEVHDCDTVPLVLLTL